VPTYAASGACSTTAGAPISCTITVTWSEKYVSAYRNAASAALASAATSGQRSYTVYLEP
jgi:type IV pilus assembly protein PilV